MNVEEVGVWGDASDEKKWCLCLPPTVEYKHCGGRTLKMDAFGGCNVDIVKNNCWRKEKPIK